MLHTYFGNNINNEWRYPLIKDIERFADTTSVNMNKEWRKPSVIKWEIFRSTQPYDSSADETNWGSPPDSNILLRILVSVSNCNL